MNELINLPRINYKLYRHCKYIVVTSSSELIFVSLSIIIELDIDSFNISPTFRTL